MKAIMPEASCTPESQYGCMYSADYPTPTTPNADGEWPVLFCIGAIGVAYPLTMTYDDFHSLPQRHMRDCKFFASPLKTRYDAHVVCVRGPDYFAVDPHNAEFH